MTTEQSSAQAYQPDARNDQVLVYVNGAFFPRDKAVVSVFDSGFALGDVLAVDVDYVAQTGYVGSGVAGAYVKSAVDVGSNADYIRRVTFNLGRVSAKDATSLTLAQPLLGGVPVASAKIQKVAAFTDREGGTFFQEWSGLFIFESEAGNS